MRAVVRRRARVVLFRSFVSSSYRVVVVVVVVVVAVSKRRRREDALEKSASGDPRARRSSSIAISRPRVRRARSSRANHAPRRTRSRETRENRTPRNRTFFFTPPPRVPRRRLRRESSVDARDQKILPKTVIPTPVRRLSPRPTTRRSRGRTPRNPSRRRGARARASSRSRLRLATSPATPRRRFYSPPRRRDTPSRVFPSTTPTHRVSSRSDVRENETSSQSVLERETRTVPRRDETRRDECMHRTTYPGRASSVDDDDAPDAVVTQRLHDARDFIRRLRRHAPTNERTTNASGTRAFDSRNDSRHRVIESNLDDGVMMSRAVRMASTRARERERKRSVAFARSVARSERRAGR